MFKGLSKLSSFVTGDWRLIFQDEQYKLFWNENKELLS